jgi:hypothetical protein
MTEKPWLGQCLFAEEPFLLVGSAQVMKEITQERKFNTQLVAFCFADSSTARKHPSSQCYFLAEGFFGSLSEGFLEKALFHSEGDVGSAYSVHL